MAANDSSGGSESGKNVTSYLRKNRDISPMENHEMRFLRIGCQMSHAGLNRDGGLAGQSISLAIK